MKKITCINAKVLYLIASLLLFSSSNAQGMFEGLKAACKTQKQFIEDHNELIGLMGCLMHIPYIATIDSQDPVVIKTSAILALVPTEIKLAHELVRKRVTRQIYELLYHIPVKTGGYTACSLYDIMRYKDAENLAIKNQTIKDSSKIKSFQINQTVCLLIEACLRLLNYITPKNTQASNRPFLSNKQLKSGISELITILELYRLLSRYGTFVSLPKVETNLNVGVDQSKTHSPEEKNFSVDVQIKASTFLQENGTPETAMTNHQAIN